MSTPYIGLCRKYYAMRQNLKNTNQTKKGKDSCWSPEQPYDIISLMMKMSNQLTHLALISCYFLTPRFVGLKHLRSCSCASVRYGLALTQLRCSKYVLLSWFNVSV